MQQIVTGTKFRVSRVGSSWAGVAIEGAQAMKVLVTGGAGFIGSNLCQRLRDGGHQVTILDDLSAGQNDYQPPAGVDFVAGDVADQDTLARCVAGIDIVVHLAAHTRVIESIQNPEQGFHTNVIGTFHLLEACRKAGVKRFINASTGGAILGEAPAPVHEELVPQPLSPYGASKLAAEGYCSAYTGAFGMRCVSLRFSNIYGPGSLHKGSVVAHFFKRVLAKQPLIVYGDGTQKRDYLFIEDLTTGIVRAIESDATGTFQLGTGAGTSLNDVIRIMRRTIGTEYPIEVTFEPARTGEVYVTWCKIDKARAAFGFAPRTCLDDGLDQTWQWFKKQMLGNCPPAFAS
jgi:UDP-glucose 4-epimerase